MPTKFIDFFSDIGVDFALFFAGLAGGFVSLSKKKQLSFWQKMLTIFSGGFTATYLTPFFVPLVNKYFSAETNLEYGIGFVIGTMGMSLVEYLVGKFKKVSDGDVQTK